MADDNLKEIIRKNKKLPMRKSQQRGQTMSPIHPSPAQQAKENLIRRSIQRMSAKRGGVDIVS